MLRIRPYKQSDAKTIVTWCQTEEIFHKWGGDHFGDYPIDGSVMNEVYLNKNGNCVEDDNFFPMTAFDENGVCGHFIMRYIHGDNEVLRFGWVIVAPERRGKGYGKEMLSLGVKYAKEIYKAKRLSIGVYEDNYSAHGCYLAVGFHDKEVVDHIIEMEMEV